MRVCVRVCVCVCVCERERERCDSESETEGGVLRGVRAFEIRGCCKLGGKNEQHCRNGDEHKQRCGRHRTRALGSRSRCLSSSGGGRRSQGAYLREVCSREVQREQRVCEQRPVHEHERQMTRAAAPHAQQTARQPQALRNSIAWWLRENRTKRILFWMLHIVHVLLSAHKFRIMQFTD